MTGSARPPVAAVTLGDVGPDRWSALVAVALQAAGDPVAALEAATAVAAAVPLPGEGDTLGRWAALATLGATDLTAARALEPHLDALAILHEAGQGSLVDPTSTWGVFAAEGPVMRLRAEGVPRWRLHGTKPWCSLARDLSHALVTAWIGDDSRGLFSVDLRQDGVVHPSQPWVPHGLAAVRSTAVEFRAVDAEPVGSPGWYLARDGFAWGGIGVAAVWFGGAVGVLRRMQAQAEQRPLDQIGEAHLGTADAALTAAGSVLVRSAEAIDAGDACGGDGELWALRTRQVVAEAAEAVLRAADHALGPGPLTGEAAHADRVADLRIYLRQHHGERDAAALGRLIARSAPW